MFVTEGQVDLPAIMAMKWGTPEFMTEYTIDTYHTPYYAAGKLFSEVNPRLGMITHTNYKEGSMGESVAEGARPLEGDVHLRRGRLRHRRRHLLRVGGTQTALTRSCGPHCQ